MKKNDCLLILSVGLYSFLFYKQNAGINVCLFNFIILIFLLVRDRSLFKKTKWWLAATGCMLSSLCIAIYGNNISVLANVLSLSFLSAMSFGEKSSFVMSLFFSLYSYSFSFVHIFLDWTERKKRLVNAEGTSKTRKVALFIIPSFVTLIFFFMYRSSNALFYNLVKDINLDFISFQWIVFTTGGFLLLYGFFYHKRIPALANLDEIPSNKLAPGNFKPLVLFGKSIQLNEEELSGRLLLILLNALLLIVNCLDANYLFIDRTLPEGIGYSEFVHQGIGMLITSILIAIVIILFYFRGSLNFFEKNGTIRMLAVVWIAQNAFMLISTAFRNNLYVSEYGLTYKRIGVYIYLLLTFIGLFTTAIKILRLKSNNYLFRVNGLLFYTVLIFSCFFNWDSIITDFNIHKAKLLEKNYLLSLSYQNLPELVELQYDSLSKKREFNLAEESDWYETDYRSQGQVLPVNYESALHRKIATFLKEQYNRDWRSVTLSGLETKRKLVVLNAGNKLNKLTLAFDSLDNILPLADLKYLKELDLGENKLVWLTGIEKLQSLEKIDLHSNKLYSLSGLEKLPALRVLDIRSNPVRDFNALYKMKNLKEIHISKMDSGKYTFLSLILPKLKIIID